METSHVVQMKPLKKFLKNKLEGVLEPERLNFSTNERLIYTAVVAYILTNYCCFENYIQVIQRKVALYDWIFLLVITFLKK